VEHVEPPAAPHCGKAAGALVQPGGQDKAKVATISGSTTRTADTEPFCAEVRARFDALERIRISEMKEFFRRGVSALTLCTPEFPARARIAWVDGTGWFDFEDEVDDGRHIEPAVIFLARDELGDPLDLFAWNPLTGRVAAYLWRAPVLGLETSWSARIADDGALPVYSSMWSWLKGGREGLLIADLDRALPILRDAGKLVVETVDLGIEITNMLDARNPKIVVRKADLVDADDSE